MSVGDLQSDVTKGRCTRNQIRIWDQLLETRIQMQKILNEANKLPQQGFDKISSSRPSNEEDNSTLNALLKKNNHVLESLLDGLLDLQNALTKQNAEIEKSRKATKRNGATSDEEVPSDEGGSDDEEINSDEAGSLDGDLFDKSEDPDDDGSEGEDEEEEEEEEASHSAKRRKIEDYASEIKKRQQDFAKYRDETIKKWNDKTQAATGSMGKKNFAAFQTPTLNQIEHILKDKNRLIKRTQLKRSAFNVIGKESASNGAQSEEDDYDAEIFDDGDFYNQLLRELISSKTSSMTDPVQLSQHWLQIQKLRSKMKRKVDTRASKGRKIRYDVHPKLVNFMARYDNSTMSENAVKELMSSLFGKRKE